MIKHGVREEKEERLHWSWGRHLTTDTRSETWEQSPREDLFFNGTCEWFKGALRSGSCSRWLSTNTPRAEHLKSWRRTGTSSQRWLIVSREMVCYIRGNLCTCEMLKYTLTLTLLNVFGKIPTLVLWKALPWLPPNNISLIWQYILTWSLSGHNQQMD